MIVSQEKSILNEAWQFYRTIATLMGGNISVVFELYVPLHVHGEIRSL